MSSHITAANCIDMVSADLIRRNAFFYGKEKVYGSIP